VAQDEYVPVGRRRTEQASPLCEDLWGATYKRHRLPCCHHTSAEPVSCIRVELQRLAHANAVWYPYLALQRQ